MAEGTECEEAPCRAAICTLYLSVSLDGESQAVPVRAGKTLGDEILDERKVQIRRVARAIEGEVRFQNFNHLARAVLQPKPEATSSPHHIHYSRLEQLGAARLEFTPQLFMHFKWQSVTVCIPERSQVA